MNRALVLLVSLAGLLAAPTVALSEHHEADVSAAPEPLAWNAQDVVEQARGLQQVSEKLRTMERKMPEDSIAAGQAKSRNRYRGLLRQMRELSRKLGDAVEGGATRDATVDDFERLRLAARNAAEEARRMFLSQATIDEIQKAEQQMRQLALYYTGETDARPALAGPKKTKEP